MGLSGITRFYMACVQGLQGLRVAARVRGLAFACAVCLPFGLSFLVVRVGILPLNPKPLNP